MFMMGAAKPGMILLPGMGFGLSGLMMNQAAFMNAPMAPFGGVNQ
jgi:hypothetical protein